MNRFKKDLISLNNAVNTPITNIKLTVKYNKPPFTNCNHPELISSVVIILLQIRGVAINMAIAGIK